MAQAIARHQQTRKWTCPVSTRSMARPMETATPMERLVLMALPGMAPEVSSSTCRFSTWTAGSAWTMNQPISMPMGIRTQLQVQGRNLAAQVGAGGHESPR